MKIPFRNLIETPPIDHLRKIKIAIDKRRRKKIINEYFATNNIIKLQIGCGYNITSGWLNTDLNGWPEHNVAMLDAGERFPFEDNSINYIFSEHIFEHLTFEQEFNMVSESFRVLKPGGYLRIATPDLDFLMNLYRQPDLKLHKDYVEWSANINCKKIEERLGGTENKLVYVNNNFYRDWGHQVIHNFSSLSEMLDKVGFSEITREKVGISSIDALSNMERHGEIIPPEFNSLETLIVQGKKPA